MTSDSHDPRVTGLSTLLLLAREARHAETADVLGFIIVNETHRIIPYRQAIFWEISEFETYRIVAASSVTTINPNAPYILWLKKLIGWVTTQPDALQIKTLLAGDFPSELQTEWLEWCPPQLVWVPMADNKGHLLSGILLFREEPWEKNELAVLEHAADSYNHAWNRLKLENRRWALFTFDRLKSLAATRRKKIHLAIFLCVILILLFPLRQTTLGPAEVVPTDPIVVTAPLDGVVKKFHIQPNDPVIAQQLLVSFDDTTIRNQNNVAQKAFEVAQAEYAKASKESFSDPESRAKLAVLEAQVEQRAVEVVYTDELLNQIELKADREGIAVFSDPNKWIGKPVVTGEKILTLADPKKAEFEIWLPIDDLIPLEPGARARVFLNVDPTHSLEGEVIYVSYESEVTTTNTGTLAYKIRAKINDTETLPRIGLKGTAKLYGEKVSLFYYMMRRPIAVLRRATGF